MCPVDPLQRTCTELLPAEVSGAVPTSHALAPVITVRELADIPVFVLLGEPGMGKSETMKALAQLVLGEQGKPIAANDFIVLPASKHNAEDPVFIDALDEARAGRDTTVWQKLRTNIADRGLTRFGVSCRVADWQTTDAQDLATVAHGQRIRVFALNPLTPEQRHIVLKSADIENADDFEKQAEALGLGDMLGNPQSLKLLVVSVKNPSKRLPQTRREAYELACQALVQEPNQRHRQVQRSGALLSDESLLDAAGWLCALMLLSNQNEVADETLAMDAQEGVRLSDVLDALPTNGLSNDTILQVLQRRLFIKPRGYTATHRTVAEYLAARHINKLVTHGGLLPQRVTALMLASGQHLVTNLRGLAGWLAVLSEPLRQLIYEVDPWAVLDYGDLNLLEAADKRALIEQLAVNQRASSEVNLWRRAAHHVPLVQSEMQDFVKQWVESFRVSSLQSRQQNLVADVLLSALIYAPADQFWEPVLMQLVRDESLGEGDRSLALSALYTHRSLPTVLTGVLEDIHQGGLKDPNARLTSSLLQHLYPQHIGPSEVLRFLKPSHIWSGSAKFPWFWSYHIEKQTPAELLPELMGALERATSKGTFADKTFRRSSHHLKGLESLVITAVEMFGSSVEIPQLSRWLLLCTNTHASPFRLIDPDNALRLGQWLRAHPNLVKKVMSYRVQEGASRWDAQFHFPSGSRPPGMGAFWLEQAEYFQSIGEPTKASECLDTAFRWIDQKDSGISLEDLENAAKQNDNFKSTLEPLLFSPLSEDNPQRRHWLDEREYRDEVAARNAQNEKNRAHLLEHLDDVRSGKLLGYLSEAAWADLKDSGYGGGSDGELLAQWREAHPELKEATRRGYQAILNQLTSSQATSVEKNHKTGHLLNIELPCLLAAQQLYAASPQSFFDLGEERLKALLTVYLLNHCSDHSWLLALAERNPDWVEEVWWALCESNLRSKKAVRIPQIGLLRDEPALRPIAQRLVSRIFTAWPSKISESNFPEFVQVLDSVLDQCAPEEVSQLVAKRLKRKSQGSLQTGYLLMAGLWVDHQTYAPLLQSLLNKKQIVQTELLGFIGHLHRYGGNPAPLPAWDAPTLGLLFRIFGPLCPAERPEGVNRMGEKDEGRAFLHQILDVLRTGTSEAAQQELQQLLSDPALHQWKFRLEEALSRQSHVKAEHAFEVPTPRQVALTLYKKSPANPSDLMAIALDALDGMQREIRNSPTNLINSFWRGVDDNGKHPLPPHKPENACRDVIAQWLSPRLAPMSITVLPELQHGDQKRSDMGLLVHNTETPEMLLPIEVKGDWHENLWEAAHLQLGQQYVSDSRCTNQGIYLVLWLGSNRGSGKKAKAHPNHPMHTPADLQMRLQLETNQKAGEQNIRVVVLDVSIPD